MTKVFISYSRKDRSFAEKLDTALETINLESWIDWDDIPPTSDWWEQIQRGVESSDGFLFLISPDSVTSNVCRQEIDFAVKNGKRLIPVVVRDVSANNVHPALAKLNWIFFREQDDFANSLKKLEEAVNTDLQWIETHTRLQVRAAEWERRKDRSLLLRGKDLHEAEEKLATTRERDPQPTNLQRQYILESQRTESRARNSVLVIGSVVIILLAMLSVFAVGQRNIAVSNQVEAEHQKGTAVANERSRATAQADAEHQRGTAIANEQEASRQAKIARAGELAAQAQINKDKSLPLSLLLAVEASRAGPPGESIPAVQQVLRSDLDTLGSTPLPIDGIDVGWDRPVFSPDSRWMANFDTKAKEIVLYDLSDQTNLSRSLSPRTSSSYPLLTFSPDSRWLINLAEAQPSFYDLTQLTAGFKVDRYSLLETDRKSYSHDNMISPDSKWLVGTADDNGLYIWPMDDLSSDAVPIKLDDDSDLIRRVEFSPDGHWMIVAYESGMLKTWKFTNKKPELAPVTISEYNQTPIFVRFSLDSKRLITSDGVKTYLWDMSNLEAKQALEGVPTDLEQSNKNCTFSPDGDWIVTVDPKTIWLYRLTAGGIVKYTLSYLNARVYGFSLDSSSLTVSNENQVDFVLLSSEEPKLHSLTAGKIELILSSPDGQQVAVTLSDKNGSHSTKIFKILQLREMILPDQFVVAFSLDEHYLITSEHFYDGNISVWDLNALQTNGDDGSLLPTLQTLLLDHRGGGRLDAVFGETPVFSPDGHWMALPTLFEFPESRPTYLLYQIENGTHELNPTLLDGEALPYLDKYLDIAISSDGKRLAASGNVTASLLEFTKNGQPRITNIEGVTSSISTMGAYRQESLVFSQDGQRLAAIMKNGNSRDPGVGLWRLGQNSLSLQPDVFLPMIHPLSEIFSITTEAHAIAFDRADPKLAIGTFAGYVALYDLSEPDIASSGSLLFLHEKETPGGFIAALQFSPDGRWLAAGDTNGVLRLWNLITVEDIPRAYTVNFKTNTVYGILFHPDSQWLVVSTKDSSDAGSTVNTSSEERALFLYDLNSTDPLVSPIRLSDFRTSVSAMAISPDGRWLAVGNDDSTIFLWEFEKIKGGQAPTIIQYPQYRWIADSVINTRISGLTFSPDSRWLAGVQGSEIRMWDLLSPNIPITFDGRAYEILFSPDSQYLFSVNGDVQAWLIDTQKLVDWACRASGRNLNMAEWAQFFPNEKYRVTCPQWSSGK